MILDIIDDVLSTILADCETPSLRALALVSSRFRSHALPHLLHSVRITKDVGQLLSFLELVTSGGDRRGGTTSGVGRHVRRLNITPHALSQSLKTSSGSTQGTNSIPVETWAPILTRALNFMPNLRAFMLDEQVEEVAHHSPRFMSTLLSHPLLTYLSLGDFGEESLASLGNACSSLAPTLRLEVVFLYGAEKEALRLAPADGLGRFLRHDSIGQHIKSLDLFYLDFTSLTRLNRDRPALLPSLGKLRLVGCNFSSSSLAAFAPGIHTLQLGTSHIQRSGPLPHVALPRLARLDAQSHHQVATLLDSSAFDPKTLRCLRLGSVNWDEATSPLAPLKAPGLKSITFLRHPVGSLSWWETFSQASPSLRFMNVSLQAMSVDEARLCIFGVPSALARLPLQYVSLSVVDHDHFLSRPEKLGIATEPIHEGIAISWAKEIPSLRHMDVRHQYSLMSPNVTHSFMIERQGNSVSVRGLGIYPAPRARES